MKTPNISTLAMGRKMAIGIANDVKAQIIKDIETQADKWVNENKLVHAGAARQLADELKAKLFDKDKSK